LEENIGMGKLQESRAALRDAWGLTRPFFVSEHKWRALGAVALLLVLTIGGAVLQRIFTEWSGTFQTALQQRDAATFWRQMAWFPALAIPIIVAAVYGFYIAQMLQLRWRRWFTQQYLQRWLSAKAFYRLEVQRNAPGVAVPDNPDQRIQEDIQNFTDLTVNLCLGLVGAFFTLTLFTGMLWSLSEGADVVLPQALGGAALDIPGFLVWVAVIYCGVGTWITFIIGRPQRQLNFDKQRLEADFRHHMVRVRDNAEAIALDGGEAVEGKHLGGRFDALLQTTQTLIVKQKHLIWFTTFFGLMASVFSFLILAPRYFRGEIEMGTMVMVSSAFGAVSGSLSWLVDNYPRLAVWRATVQRLVGFERSLQAPAAAVAPQPAAPDEGLQARLDHVALPTGRKVLVDVALQAQAGERILIEGTSGGGKSTLLRVLAGIWPYAQGQLQMPENAMFIPQRPYFPDGPLRDALAYPESAERYSDAQLREALQNARLPNLVDQLDHSLAWGQLLSGGEKQRLSVARVFLKRPAWVFADEASSALDNATEQHIYQQLVQLVQEQGGALVSVAHRDTVRGFHTVTWHLDPQTQSLRVMPMATSAGVPQEPSPAPMNATSQE
jgi:putative ATP-binding cassette transporter